MLQLFDVGSKTASRPEATILATAINRIVILNGLVAALDVALLYFIVRCFRVGRAAASITAIAFGCATTTWLFAASGEHQLFGAFFELVAIALLVGIPSGASALVRVLAAASALVLLSVAALTYLPMVIFGVIALVLLARCLSPVFAPPWPSVKAITAAVIGAIVVFSGLVALVTPFSGEYFVIVAINQFEKYVKADAGIYQSLLTVENVINNVLAISTYFTNWIKSFGYHEIRWSQFGQHGLLSVIGYVLSLPIFAALGAGLWIGCRELWAFVRGVEVWHLEPQRYLAAGAFVWTLFGVVAVIATRLGSSTDFWTFVMVGAMPAFAVFIDGCRRRTYAAAVVVAALFVVNFAMGADRFSRGFEARTDAVMREVGYAWSYVESAPRKAVLLIYYGSGVKLWPRYTWGRVETRFVNEFPTTEAFKDYVDGLIASGTEIHALRETIDETTLDRLPFRTFGDSYAERVRWLVSTFDSEPLPVSNNRHQIVRLVPGASAAR